MGRGRPRKTGLDWFAHDTKASADDKLKRAERKFGNDAYAVFFKTLENIYGSSQGELDLSTPDAVEFYAAENNLAVEKYETVIAALVSLGLFERTPAGTLQNRRATQLTRSVQSRRERQRILDPGSRIIDTEERRIIIDKTRQEEIPQKFGDNSEIISRKIVDKSKINKRKILFNPKGKVKYLDYVYLSEAQLNSVIAFYSQKNLDKSAVKDAIRKLDAWFTNNPHMRNARVDDAKTLKGWPLREVLIDRAAQAKAETQAAYKDTAELTAYQLSQS